MHDESAERNQANRLRGLELGRAVLRDRAERAAQGLRAKDNRGDAARYGVSVRTIEDAVRRAKISTTYTPDCGLEVAFSARKVDPSAIVQVPFYRGFVLGVLLDGVAYVFLRPILNEIGVDMASQLQKIRSTRFSTCVGNITTHRPGDDRIREHVVITTKALGILLAGINESKVKPEAREMLFKFQDEVADVIDDYLTGSEKSLKHMTRQEALRAFADQLDREEEALRLAEEYARQAALAERKAIEAQVRTLEVEAVANYLGEFALKWETFLDTKGEFSITDSAAVMGGSTRPDFIDFLMEHGVIYKPDAQQGGGLTLRAEWRDERYAFMVAEQVGKGSASQTVMVIYFTARGLERIHELLMKHGWGVVRYYPANSIKGRPRKGGELPTKEQVMERAAMYVKNLGEIESPKDLRT